MKCAPVNRYVISCDSSGDYSKRIVYSMLGEDEFRREELELSFGVGFESIEEKAAGYIDELAADVPVLVHAKDHVLKIYDPKDAAWYIRITEPDLNIRIFVNLLKDMEDGRMSDMSPYGLQQHY